VICDGEMRRFFFVQTFYGKMDGLETLEPLRKTGLYAYDSVPRYRATRKVTVPKGLGTVEEFKYLQTQTDKPIKATCPGPVTLSSHPDPPGRACNNDRLALCWDLVPPSTPTQGARCGGGGGSDRRALGGHRARQAAEYMRMFVRGRSQREDRLPRASRQPPLLPAAAFLVPLDVPGHSRDSASSSSSVRKPQMAEIDMWKRWGGPRRGLRRG
jgi:hypothetical protein